MLDISHIPTPNGIADVQTFVGLGRGTGSTAYRTWIKPRGKAMASILLVGGGGDGGTGVVGAAGGGGGGGASGSMVALTLPLWAIPDVLYLNLGSLPGGANSLAAIMIRPDTTVVANNTLAYALNGGNGGNAVTTAAGAAGASSSAATGATMPLGWMWVTTALAGQAGTAGGAGTTTGTTPTALALPVTGLIVTGGTGAGACPTTVGAGTAGGARTGAGLLFPTITGAALGTGTTPPDSGVQGFNPVQGLQYGYGGTGGGGVGSNATGAGLVQSSGGDGAPGCGGGGMGGAFTGSTAGRIGLGGPAFCIITCW